MPAFVAGLPSPVLRDFPLPAKVSMMPTAMTLLSIDCPSPQSATSCLRRLRRRRGGRRRRDSRLGPRRPVRRDRLLDLRLLRAGFRFDGVRFMHRLLEALDGFAQLFAKLRELAGPEDDQHDEENQDQFGDAHASKHSALPCQWRSEEHTSELQSRQYLVCRLLLEKKK